MFCKIFIWFGFSIVYVIHGLSFKTNIQLTKSYVQKELSALL